MPKVANFYIDISGTESRIILIPSPDYKNNCAPKKENHITPRNIGPSCIRAILLIGGDGAGSHVCGEELVSFLFQLS